MIATTIDILEAQTRWRELLSLVLAGNEVVVTKEQKPVMRMAPIEDSKKQRVPGLHAGMGWVTNDFDAPLPDEFWTGAA